MDDDVYIELREFLDRMPAGFPATESETAIEYLKWMFTPEEAEVEVNLRAVPEPVAVIAERCGIEEAKAEEILESMARKGLIYPLRTKKKTLYTAMQYLAGFAENLANRMGPGAAEWGPRYYEESGFKSPVRLL